MTVPRASWRGDCCLPDALFCCPVLSGPLVSVEKWASLLHRGPVHRCIIYSIFSSRCCRAGFGCRLFSPTSSALPLAAVTIVQATESPPLPLCRNKAIHTRVGQHRESPQVLCPSLTLLPPQVQAGPGRLVAWSRGPVSVGPSLPLVWQQ